MWKAVSEMLLSFSDCFFMNKHPCAQHRLCRDAQLPYGTAGMLDPVRPGAEACDTAILQTAAQRSNVRQTWL